MKTPKVNREEVRDNSLVITMTNDEKKAVQEAANNVGISMSAFARMALRDFVQKVK